MMTNFEALLPWIQSFLKDDLGSVLLPPPIETKRLTIVDQLERLSQTVVQTNASTTLPVAAAQPVAQRRPLSTVARLFASSRKRFSLPASISLAPPLIEVPLPAQNSPRYTEPPLPPKGTHKARLSGEVGPAYQDYEEPRLVISKAADQVRQRRRPPLARLSLSPQLEIVECNRTDVPRQTGPHDEPSSVLDDNQDDIDLTLPKRCLTTQARRFSSFMDPPWTLAGALHHRYKPNKWTRLSLCLLIGGSRLIGYRSGHALTPNLVLFLCGSTAIYAGRDSGMDHVIKIALSTRGMAVLAADTEEQALVWIKQINMYAQGITPSETRSFLEQPSRIPSNPNTAANGVKERTETGATTTEPQEDSGFSAPLSSGSEGNSADGIVPCQSHVLVPAPGTIPYSTSSCLGTDLSPSSRWLTSVPTTQPIELDQVRLRHKEKATDGTCKSRPASLFSSSSRTTLPGSFRPPTLLRRDGGGLLSSMRRKVESFHSKRRARKSLPQSFLTPVQTNALGKANSSADLLLNNPVTMAGRPCHQRTGSDGQWLLGDGETEPSCPVPPPPAACVLNSPARVGPGFDWAQLESASSLFLNSSNSGSSGLRRPHSFVLASPSTDYGHVQSFPESLSHVTPPRLGPLLDLNVLSSIDHHNPRRSDVDNRSQIIIAGEACISIPGKVPWTNRWCCLRSRCLDVYPLASQPCSNVSGSATTDELSGLASNAWPLFSLSLEPGQVELGLAGDKRHKAAVRLAVPKQSATPLLFDVPDKLRMGDWIRGFIQALGIIPSSTDDSVPESKSNTALPVSSDPSHGQELHNSGSACSPPQTCFEYDAPDEFESPEKVVYSPEASDPNFQQSSCPDHLIVANSDQYQLEGFSDCSSVNIYDEVCPPSQQDQAVVSDSQFKRRWSSPSLPLDSIAHPGVRWFGSAQTGVPSSEAFDPNMIRSWRIPPPSRRLLAQPLPPLPSVGPSGAESIAGTMTSSRTSSSQTPEGSRIRPCSGSSPSSEPELIHSNTPHAVRNRHPKTSSRGHQRRCKPLLMYGHQTPQSSPNVYSNPRDLTRKRHASVGSLDEQQRYTMEQIEPRTTEPSSTHPPIVEVLDWLVDTAQSYDTEVPMRTDLDWSTRSGHTVKPSGRDHDTSSASGGTSTIQTTSASEISLPRSSEVLMNSGAPQLPWFDLSEQWWLNHHPRPDHIAAARRSVSCVTGTKPYLEVTNTRTVSTLPARHETEPTVLRSLFDQQAQFAEHSPHTATSSSGVALTAGSSSFSESSETTRPGSHLALSWPPPPVPEEPSSWPDLDPTDSCVCPSELQKTSISDAQPLARESPPETQVATGQSSSMRNDIEVQCDSSVTQPCRNKSLSNAHVSLPLNRSPNNTSLILVATQLEEVHQEAKNLHWRRQTLSSRLSSSLARDRRHTTECLLPSSMCDTRDPTVATLKVSPAPACATDESVVQDSNEDLSSHTIDSTLRDTGENNIGITEEKSVAEDEQEGAEGLEEEAVASLCARLAAIELLIQQAESTEARLREEFNQCLRQNTTKSHHVAPAPNGQLSKPLLVTPSTQKGSAPITTEAVSPSIVLSPRRRRRGRHARLAAVTQTSHEPDHSSQLCETTRNPSSHPSQSRGRGGTGTNTGGSRGGGRSRRRNGGPGTRRERRQPPGGNWNQTSNPNACPVALSPAS